MATAAPDLETKFLPANAYQPLKDGELYVPLVPTSMSVREVPWRAVSESCGVGLHLAHSGKNLPVELGSDPKSRFRYQFIEYWLHALDQARPLGFEQYAQ